MIPGLTQPAIQSAQGFRVLMQAMALPGTIHRLDLARAPALGAAAGSALLILADPTTPLHLAGPLPGLADWLRFHAGCPLSDPGGAALAVGRWSDLLPLLAPMEPAPGQAPGQATGRAAGLPRGLPDYPDRSATVIVELDRLEPEGARLTGPGIRDRSHLSLPDPAPFRDNHALFPMGLDFIFTCGDRLACLPRSTTVEAA